MIFGLETKIYDMKSIQFTICFTLLLMLCFSCSSEDSENLNLNGALVEGLHLSLKASNTVESASSRNVSESDCTIQLKDGNTSISTFTDYGEGYLSDEKDFISILTDAGSERTYTLVGGHPESVTIIQHFILFDEESETWRRTYQKESADRWVLKNCEGDCN